jgi:plastocyanin
VIPTAALRSVFGLLLGEHGVLVASSTDALLRQRSADFAAGQEMLAASSLQLASIIGALFGADAQDTFYFLWRSYSNGLFQYATALAAGDITTADTVRSRLAKDEVDLAALALDWQAPALHQLLPAHTESLLAVIDAQARWTPQISGDQRAAYPALRAAHTSADVIAAELAAAVRRTFERFSGEADMIRRARIEMLLREHAFLVAASVAAALTARNIEFEAAAGALDQNAQMLAQAILENRGDHSEEMILQLWRKQNGLIINYALAHIGRDKAQQIQLRSELQQHATSLGARFDAATVNENSAQAQGRMATYVAFILSAVDAMAAGDIDAYFVRLCEAYHTAPAVGVALAEAMPAGLAATMAAPQASFTPAPAPAWRWAVATGPAVAVSIPVLISESSFQPSRIEVPQGATIVWFNQDVVTHTLVAGVPEHETDHFPATSIEPGGQFSLAFAQAGEYPYFSRHHDLLRGVVVVKPY